LRENDGFSEINGKIQHYTNHTCCYDREYQFKFVVFFRLLNEWRPDEDKQETGKKSVEGGGQ
jgi:hypothetical protein